MYGGPVQYYSIWILGKSSFWDNTTYGNCAEINTRSLFAAYVFGQKKNPVLLSNLLIAAKLLVAQKWKSLVVPTIYEWQSKCQHLLLMNKLTTIAKARNGSTTSALTQFGQTWEKFLNYWNESRPHSGLRKKILEIV